MNDKFTQWLYEHSPLPGWPTPNGEPLDTENLQVVKIASAGVEFCCGGDWQEPQRLLLTPGLRIEVLDRELEEWPSWDTVIEGGWPGWLRLWTQNLLIDNRSKIV